MSAEGGVKAVVAALLANAGIAVSKFVAFLFTGSSAMLAETVHSVADTGNQGLLLLGRRRARRGPTEEHPFGFGRERYFWAFVVALVLFSLGSLFALYEGYHKIVDPHPLESAGWAFGVLLVAIVLESFSFRTAIIEANRDRGDRSFGRFVRTAKSPELPVVLLEDLAALTGLVFALAGVTLAVVTGDGRWDGAGSLAIGALLGVVAIFLAVEMKSLLLGESASPEVLEQIERALCESDGVTHVIHMRTSHLGPDELLVAAKLGLEPGLSMPDVARIIDEAEVRVRRAAPIAKVMYLEPDLYRPERAQA